jgi:hypothetical protein
VPSGKKGKWVVECKTMNSRLSRTLKRISMRCSVHRHLPIKDLGAHEPAARGIPLPPPRVVHSVYRSAKP